MKSQNQNKMPKMKLKKKEVYVCNDCGEPVIWLDIGDPEGAFFQCSQCNNEYDKEGNEL